MKKNKFNSITSKITLYYFTLTISIFIITVFIFFIFLSRQIKKIEEEKLENSLNSSSKYINLYLDKIKEDIRYIENSEIINLKNKETIKNNLINIKKKDINIKNISIISKDKNQIYTNYEVKIKTDIDSSIILNPTRKINYNNMDSYILSFLKKGDNIDVVIDIGYIKLYDYLKTVYLGEMGEIYIVDDKNNIIYSKNIESDLKNKEMVRKIDNMMGYQNIKNKIYFRKKIEKTNWTIIGVYSGEKIEYLKTRLIYALISFIILLSIIIYILNNKISKKLTSSIVKIKEHMENMGSSLEKIEIRDESFSEIEVLKKNINEMIEKINLLKKYEIEVLYSQINPHFLYNTLDIIIWMIEFEDNDKAVLLTKKLAEFFRLSLNRADPVISLEKEINHIKLYLDIQKERYKSKLNYSINIKDECILKEMIPKIIIQPIVENSIYHGIKNIEEDGYIDINIYKKEKDIYIEIRDNGIGMNNSKYSNNLKLGGVGIKNIDMRLKSYFGKEYGVFIENVKKGSLVILKLKGVKTK